MKIMNTDQCLKHVTFGNISTLLICVLKNHSSMSLGWFIRTENGFLKKKFFYFFKEVYNNLQENINVRPKIIINCGVQCYV